MIATQKIYLKLLCILVDIAIVVLTLYESNRNLGEESVMSVKTTLLFGVAAITLAACATPEQRCERRAADPYQKLVAQISEVEMNISRGYAIETVAVRGESYRGTGRLPVRTITHGVETRQVPILPNLERQKLVYLQGSLEKAAAQRDAALMQCGAIAGN